MRGSWTVLAALWALVACVDVTHGDSLRALLQHQLSQTEMATGQLLMGKKKNGGGGGPNCKPEKAGTESRTCEPPQGSTSDVNTQTRCNECSQQCHSFGDPHLKVFQSGCTTKVFDGVGRWTFFKAPGLTFDVGVEKVKKKKFWIMQAYVNGDLILDANKDCTGPDDNHQETVPLKSDEATKKKWASDVDVTWFVGCRYRGGNPQLEVMVTVDDRTNGPSPNKNKRPKAASDAVNFWADASGACVDPITDGGITGVSSFDDIKWDCSKGSHLATMDGRQCACSSECAVYGDPHIANFARKMTGKNGKTFMMPKVNTWASSNWESILWTAENKFAVQIGVDECEFVAEATVWMMKPASLKKFTQCSKNRPLTVSQLDSKDFEVIRYKADEECNYDTSASSPDNRKVINIPDTDSEFYDAAVRGYNTGRQALLKHPDGREEAIMLDEDTDKDQCLEKLGYGGKALKNSEEISLGGVKVLLKCHHRPDGTPYFNICVDRRGLKTEIIGDGAYDQKANDKIFLKVENAARTGGWCATGDYKGKTQEASIAATAFEERTAGQADGFKMIDGSQDS